MDTRSVLEATRIAHRCLTNEAKIDEFTKCKVLSAIFRLTDIEPMSSAADQISNDTKLEKTPLDFESAQRILSSINEFSETRKNRGVYYTPRDVVDFVIACSVNAYYGVDGGSTVASKISAKIPTDHFIFELSTLDPTCGLGEFVRGVLSAKIELLKQRGGTVKTREISAMLATLSGNDMDSNSASICRLRLFIDCVAAFGYEISLAIVNEIYEAFTVVDFINAPNHLKRKFDLILGNPPYVEDSKYGILPKKYGNVYCNVLSNSLDLLHEEGVLGYIIPLSYVATPRMHRIREEIAASLPRQTVLSFADRPDSLFKQVHQKLCILIASSGETRRVRTSNYKYWYKDQRHELFENISVYENPFGNRNGIPKLGSKDDLEIFELVTGDEFRDIYPNSRNGEFTVSLNRRETFWMKVFRGKHNHPEFKEFHFTTEVEASFIYCLLNSSLFWWYWIAVSDCWHVSKTLNGFKMPSGHDLEKFSSLALELDEKLEKTKKYVGTKQTEHEYKHSDCLDIIHDIDDEIMKVYSINAHQSLYLKNFALEYRTSRKVKYV